MPDSALALTVPPPDERARLYATVERAMALIADFRDEQPSLEEIARAVGMSPHHFQRTFTRWVGVSPKKFLQYLTLAYAKARLAEAASVMDAAWDAGLSGPSRLHDLFVTHEATTPGEFKQRGRGLEIRWAWCPSPFGDALVMVTHRGLCGLAFADARGRDQVLADMRGRWPAAAHVEDRAAAAPVAEAIFAGSGGIRLHLMGTNFQVRVWEALLRIPPGALVAYGDVAAAAGVPRAARAVGAAIGRNPVSFLIPCHRAILAGGYVRNYEWGIPRKLAMIGWEAAARERATA